MSPATAMKLSWKDNVHSTSGIEANHDGSGKSQRGRALPGRPSHSAMRKRLNMMADRRTGGCIPVSAEYSQTMTRVTTR